MKLRPYDRFSAVRYAHRWAYQRNPAYLDFSELGGDCTNFVSQCLFAGCGIMNFTPTYGWYYIDPENRAPAWTGVPYLNNFLLRNGNTVGPFAVPVEIGSVFPGDVVQLSFQGIEYQHTALVVSVRGIATPDSVLVAAHSVDADFRPLNTYDYQQARYLHIAGSIIP